MVMPSLKTGRDAARRRFWLAMSGFVMALALLPFSYKVERRLETGVHIKGGESEKVDLELAQRFQSPYAHRLVLVISGIPDPDSAKGAEALGFLTSSLRSVPGVAGAVSSLNWPDPLFTGDYGGALIIVGLDPNDENFEKLVPNLRARADWMEGQLRSQYPDIRLEITGETPLNFDLRKVSADDVKHAEERAMPVTLVLLVIAFGSLVAALLPLGVGLLSISMALGAAALLANHLHLSILVQNLVTMLGLGLGIDYALLMVSRFREALAEGYAPGHAADIAAGAGGTDADNLGHNSCNRIFSAADCAHQRTALHRHSWPAGYRFECHAVYIHSALGAWSARPSHQHRQTASSRQTIQNAGQPIRGECAVGSVGQHHNRPAMDRSGCRRDSAAYPCIPSTENLSRGS
jgi:RND superfamily putative drug exporter